MFNNCTLGWFSEGWFSEELKISRPPYSDTVCFAALIAAHLYTTLKSFKGWLLRFSSHCASICVPLSLLFPSHFPDDLVLSCFKVLTVHDLLLLLTYIHTYIHTYVGNLCILHVIELSCYPFKIVWFFGPQIMIARTLH